MLTLAAADRLERALVESSYWRGAELAHVAGNPLAIQTRSFGSVRARAVPVDLAYYRYFSGPIGLRTADAAVVPALANWFAERGAPCFVRLSPLVATEDLLRALSRSGLTQTGFMSLRYGEPSSDQHSPATDVRVIEARPDDRQSFIDLWTADAPAAERRLRMTLAAAEFSHWRCYVAVVGEQSAAHAAMFISRATQTAVLAAAATLPAFRGRGAQTALIHRRLADAAAAGCTLLAVEATPGSQSERNLERIGLRLAYTRVVWSL